jgi:hypothetical protein
MGYLRRHSLVLGAIVAFGLAVDSPAAERGTPPVIDCQTRSQVIGRAPARSPRDVVAGPVTFYRAREYAGWDRELFEPQRGASLAPVKLPIIIDTGPGATLELSERSARHAILWIGRDTGPDLRGPAATLVPCPPGAEVADRPVGPRTIFLGGFRVDGPRCLEVTISSPSMPRPRTREIPLGRDCGKR